MKNRVVTFKCTIKRRVWGSDTFKIYAVDVDEDELKKNDLKRTKYSTVSICGNIQELSTGLDYMVKAEETYNDKNGYTYKVINITRDKPKSAEDMYLFLKEVITERQAESLFKAYPNIVEKVVNGDLSDIDLNKTPGIKEYTFNIIKEKIIDNYAVSDLMVYFKGYLTMNMLKKIHDAYPSVEKVKFEMKRDPYKCLMQLSGVGFIKADNIILELEKEKVVDFGYEIKSSKQRCLACVMYQLEQNENNGNTWMDIIELRKVVMKLTPACTDHFVDCLKENVIYYNKDKLQCALRRTYMTEVYIAESIRARLHSNCEKWNYDIEKYRNACGFPLSDEQIGLLKSVCDNQFVLLTAAGGTGKSFSTKALVDMLVDHGKSVTLASPTGKAAKKLSEYTGRDANTIHRTLGYGQKGFEYNEDNPLTTDVLIIDEFGMVDIFLFKSLLLATPYTTKIVLVGDRFQLSSVGAGNILSDLIESNKVPIVEFTKVFRMGVGGVLTACTYVRENHKFITENTMMQLGEDKSYTFIPSSKEKINQMILALYKKLLLINDAKDITVLSSYNVGDNGCNALNALLQPIANPNAKPSNQNFIKMQQDKNEVFFYEGDSILQNVNNYKASLYYGEDIVMEEEKEIFVPNGEQGKIVKILDKNRIVIDFNGYQVLYSYADLSSVKHSFALSVNKFQGSQNKIIIFCMPSSHTFFLTNNLTYTGLSRAEETVYHFSDVKTFNNAMNKFDNKRRQTFLCDLLKTK